MNSIEEKWEFGSSLDDVLKKHGLYEFVTIQANIRLLVELSSEMAKLAKDISKLAKEMSKMIEESTDSEQKITQCKSMRQQPKIEYTNLAESITTSNDLEFEDSHID